MTEHPDDLLRQALALAHCLSEALEQDHDPRHLVVQVLEDRLFQLQDAIARHRGNALASLVP
ncbi:hypothetical protein [Ferrimonas balearica]|uniref:hypothetical protein n=1 Tax=Ferrimonas balearica TaxID=44012 RepID=UPI001C98AF4A|nr:hypothetical protein [Ferrimonas balearica]MBY6223585.1 hypothetical protein [Ferrimonas balearica]